MGFAASQARLLLLTARKSDLEYRAQQITNAEMMLAMRSEEVANKYSRKISNQTCKAIENGEEVKLTAAWLMSHGYQVKVMRDGAPVDNWDMDDQNYEPVYKYNFNAAKLQEDVDNGLISASEAEAIKGAAYKSYSAQQWAAMGGVVNVAINNSKVDISDYYYQVEDVAATLAQGKDLGRDLFYGVKNGELQVFDASNNPVSLDNGTGFVVCYDTADDEAADAEYKRETAAIQVKEKRLQMEMKQIEAQQKACENEIESAKKLQDKNADSMFKYMS